MANAPGRFEVGRQVGQERGGPICHCFADVGAVRRGLEGESSTAWPRAAAELAQWLEGQLAVDRAADARKELAIRGLIL